MSAFPSYPRLFVPPWRYDADAHLAEKYAPQWIVGGVEIAVLVWTKEEFERLRVKPGDAVQSEFNGTWCAVRKVEGGD